MAKYRVLELSFIKDALQPEGTILELPDEFDPSYNLEPLDDAAWAARERWEAAEDARLIANPRERWEAAEDARLIANPPEKFDGPALSLIAELEAKGRAIPKPEKQGKAKPAV
jgi:hypothetical protein